MTDTPARAVARWAVLGVMRLFLTDEPDVLLCTFAERPAMKVCAAIGRRSEDISEA